MISLVLFCSYLPIPSTLLCYWSTSETAICENFRGKYWERKNQSFSNVSPSSPLLGLFCLLSIKFAQFKTAKPKCHLKYQMYYPSMLFCLPEIYSYPTTFLSVVSSAIMHWYLFPMPAVLIVSFSLFLFLHSKERLSYCRQFGSTVNSFRPMVEKMGSTWEISDWYFTSARSGNVKWFRLVSYGFCNLNHI